MSSLMTLTNAHIKEIRRGRWFVVYKYGEAEHMPQWRLESVDGVMADRFKVATVEMDARLHFIQHADSHAQMFSVRETEPIKSLFLKSGAVNTICDCIRGIYEHQSGILLADVLKGQEVSA